MNTPPVATRPSWARAVLARGDRLRLLPRKWRGKLYRASLPRPLKHQFDLGPRFHLDGNSPDLARTLYWDGRQVGRTQALNEIENRHAGKACFVLGTGPSIADLDLSLLAKHAVFGVNGAIAVMKNHGLRPSHYSVTDLDFFENRFDMIRDVVQSGCDCFFSSGGLRVMAEKGIDLLGSDHLYLAEVVNRPSDDARRPQEAFLSWAESQASLRLPDPPRADDSRVGWSRDLRHGVFCSRTILFRALQMGAFLGYERLYVLGMDLNYKGPEARAYDEGKNARPTKIERDFDPFIRPAFEVLREEMSHSELQVFNLSSKSRLPESLLPRISFGEALERESG